MTDSRIVYYSLLIVNNEPHYSQWVRSIQSLRKYNKTIPCYLFLFGDCPPEVMDAVERFEVTLLRQISYFEYLEKLLTGRGAVLQNNPRLHKYLVLDFFDSVTASQILYVDSDTFFFDDVGIIFDRYKEFRWYAREEPFSKRSSLGYDPLKINEEFFARLAEQQKTSFIQPYNSGVFLLNNGLWEDLVKWRPKLLNYAFRIMSFFSGNEAGGEMLVVPSQYEWILGQISLWLTLGHIEGITHGVFRPSDVIQNREHLWLRPGDRPVLIHYFSNWESMFLNLLDKKDHAVRHYASKSFQRGLKRN